MDAAEAEATKVRQGEHADYLKASSDFKASAEAVAKAMEVLNNYYSSASFLQVQVTTGQAPNTPSEQARNKTKQNSKQLPRPCGVPAHPKPQRIQR